MSSRFVSAGAIDPTTGEAATQPPANAINESSSDPRNPASDDKWAAVERELAEEKKRKEAHKAALAAGGEKSLFEVLEANKGNLAPVLSQLSPYAHGGLTVDSSSGEASSL
jgi:hypothetical protein